MDWNKYKIHILVALVAAAAGLGGALIGGFFMLESQEIAQGHEDARALRRVAYESAMIEWKTKVDNNILMSNGEPFPAVFLVYQHFVLAGRLQQFNLTDNFEGFVAGAWGDVLRLEKGILKPLMDNKAKAEPNGAAKDK